MMDEYEDDLSESEKMVEKFMQEEDEMTEDEVQVLNEYRDAPSYIIVDRMKQFYTLPLKMDVQMNSLVKI